MRRRDFITLIGSAAAWPLGTMAVAGTQQAAAADAIAPQTERAMHAIYFVPGGRIGFDRPPDIAPWSNSWELMSKDQTLRIAVREALRIDANWDGRMWDQDDRQALVASGALSPAIAYRRFRDKRYGNSADYGADTYALRDDHWIGQISASTSTLGSPGLSIPGGQIQRWRPVIEAILGSITVRPPPAVSQALAEHRMSLAVDGLNARFVGDQLVMSLATPRTPQEASGITGSRIYAPRLAILPLGSPQARAEAVNQAFDSYSKSPGSRVVTGSPCRGVVLKERTPSDPSYPISTTTLMAFGRTRQLELTASYGPADRELILRALERLHASLQLFDDP